MAYPARLEKVHHDDEDDDPEPMVVEALRTMTFATTRGSTSPMGSLMMRSRKDELASSWLSLKHRKSSGPPQQARLDREVGPMKSGLLQDPDKESLQRSWPSYDMTSISPSTHPRPPPTTTTTTTTTTTLLSSSSSAKQLSRSSSSTISSQSSSSLSASSSPFTSPPFHTSIHHHHHSSSLSVSSQGSSARSTISRPRSEGALSPLHHHLHPAADEDPVQDRKKRSISSFWTARPRTTTSSAFGDRRSWRPLRSSSAQSPTGSTTSRHDSLFESALSSSPTGSPALIGKPRPRLRRSKSASPVPATSSPPSYRPQLKRKTSPEAERGTFLTSPGRRGLDASNPNSQPLTSRALASAQNKGASNDQKVKAPTRRNCTLDTEDSRPNELLAGAKHQQQPRLPGLFRIDTLAYQDTAEGDDDSSVIDFDPDRDREEDPTLERNRTAGPFLYLEEEEADDSFDMELAQEAGPLGHSQSQSDTAAETEACNTSIGDELPLLKAAMDDLMNENFDWRAELSDSDSSSSTAESIHLSGRRRTDAAQLLLPIPSLRDDLGLAPTSTIVASFIDPLETVAEQPTRRRVDATSILLPIPSLRNDDLTSPPPDEPSPPPSRKNGPPPLDTPDPSPSATGATSSPSVDWRNLLSPDLAPAPPRPSRRRSLRTEMFHVTPFSQQPERSNNISMPGPLQNVTNRAIHPGNGSLLDIPLKSPVVTLDDQDHHLDQNNPATTPTPSVSHHESSDQEEEEEVLVYLPWPKVADKSQLYTIDETTPWDYWNTATLQIQVDQLLVEKRKLMDRLAHFRKSYEDRVTPFRDILEEVRKLREENERLKNDKKQVDQTIFNLQTQMITTLNLAVEKTKDLQEQLEAAHRRNRELQLELESVQGRR